MFLNICFLIHAQCSIKVNLLEQSDKNYFFSFYCTEYKNNFPLSSWLTIKKTEHDHNVHGEYN